MTENSTFPIKSFAVLNFRYNLYNYNQMLELQKAPQSHKDLNNPKNAQK